MRNLKVFYAVLVLTCAPAFGAAQEKPTVAAVVQQTIEEQAPEWCIVSVPHGGNHPEEEEQGVTLEVKRNNQKVAISIAVMKTEEAARNILFIGTMTAIMRRGYVRSADGEALTKLADEAMFFANGTSVDLPTSVRASSYTADFFRGRVVVFVKSKKADLAQKFALLIARSLPAAR